jgi:phospholipid:diacylglycerol acyltransferase
MGVRKRAKRSSFNGPESNKSQSDSGFKDVNKPLDSNLSPEDILADSRSLTTEIQPWYRKRIFHFALGLTIGILAAFGLSSTPIAQSHISEIQEYMALYIADMDIASKIPNTDLMDELFGNVTSFIKPIPPSEQPFMPALQAK